jgi:PAS domain S-box-containing protein
MVNQECINMFEYNNQSDMIGLKASTLFNGDNGVKLDEGNTDGNSLFRNEKLYAKTKKGNIFPTELSSSFFLNENGQLTGFVIIIRDISEREKLDQLQERFIAMTSHELRTPVHIIQGYVEFLNSKAKISPSRQKEILNNLERSINRLMRLVNAFHDVSAIKSDQFKITKRKESISTFISLMYSQFRHFNRVIFVTINPEIYKINTILVDLDRVLQVIDNLCSNAIKNSSEESVIEITVTYEIGLLKLIVTDTGVGIPIKHLTNLFQPFSHKSSKYSVSGTGLGLFIVKQIVLAHKGTLIFQTQENYGTTICVSFPINEK